MRWAQRRASHSPSGKFLAQPLTLCEDPFQLTSNAFQYVGHNTKKIPDEPNVKRPAIHLDPKEMAPAASSWCRQANRLCDQPSVLAPIVVVVRVFFQPHVVDLCPLVAPIVLVLILLPLISLPFFPALILTLPLVGVNPDFCPPQR